MKSLWVGGGVGHTNLNPFFLSFKGRRGEAGGDAASEEGYSSKSIWRAPLSSLNSAQTQGQPY